MKNHNLLIIPFFRKKSAKNKSYLLIASNVVMPNGTFEVVTGKSKLLRILRNLNLFHNKYVCDVNTATIIKDLTSGDIDYFTSKPKLIREKTSKHLADYILKRTLLKRCDLSSSSHLKYIRNKIMRYNLIPLHFCSTNSTKNIVKGCSIKLVRLLSDTTFFTDHFVDFPAYKLSCSPFFPIVSRLKNPQDLSKKKPYKNKDGIDPAKYYFGKMDPFLNRPKYNNQHSDENYPTIC